MGQFIIRSATCDDVSAVNAINSHYVQNSVMTFQLHTLSDADFFEQKMKPVQEAGLPYLVATDPDNSTSVLGYACASTFLPKLPGYSPTVEFSLFVAPEEIKAGIGSALLTKLLEILKHPAAFPGFVEPQEDDAPSTTTMHPNQVLGKMVVDETTLNGGLWLRDYYRRWGFKEAGLLRRVGYKLGRR